MLIIIKLPVRINKPTRIRVIISWDEGALVLLYEIQLSMEGGTMVFVEDIGYHIEGGQEKAEKINPAIETVNKKIELHYYDKPVDYPYHDNMEEEPVLLTQFWD